MAALWTLIVKIVSFAMTVISFFTGITVTKASYAPVDGESIDLNIAVLSDVHMDPDSIERAYWLTEGLKDISRSSVPTDAVIFAGDDTNNGEPYEYKLFFDVISSFSSVPQTLVAIGNHDTWAEQASFDSFCETYSSHTGEVIDKPYYAKEINGYKFIIIGSEKKMQNEAYLSQEQLNWVDTELAKVTDKDKPVILINHQPMNGTNRVDEAWVSGILGEQSDELMQILKKYTENGLTVVSFSGHLHSGLGYSGVTNDGNLYFVDCPSFGKTPSRGEVIEIGTGYVVEGYDGKLIIRARNFVNGIFYDKYTYTIEINEEIPPLTPSIEEPAAA